MELNENKDKKADLKKCFKIKHEVIKPINIVYNLCNSNVLFWNKYQLFLYEDMVNEDNSKYFIPQFHIQQVIAFNNWIVCLDTSGNVHTSPLKFKSTGVEKVRITFQPRAHNILALLRINDNSILTFKNEYNECYICLHKANNELQLIKKIQLSLPEDDRVLKPIAEDVIFKSTPLLKKNLILLKDLLEVETYFEDASLNIISLDKKTIFCCLISKATNDHIKLLKLYTCASKICDIKVDLNDEDVHVLIGLTVGTVIKLPLLTKAPNVVYLNTALHQFEIINKTLVYTDGNTMWKAEDLFSGITFKQLNLRSVNNFIYVGDWIIATTFNNVIYSLNENVCSQYKTEDSHYSSAEKILNNMEYLDEILREVEKNKELVKKIEKEKNYLTVLSLSNRQDLVSKMIICQILVYENYQDIVNEESNVLLTENLLEYFAPNTILFAVKIDLTELKNHFEKLLNHLKSPNIHLMFESLGKIIKTSSLSVKLLSNVTNIVVPIHLNRIINQIAIHIKLTPNIPGVYDEKSKTWSILYTNTFILKSEQFIKCSNLEKPLLLKEKTPIEELITKTAINVHGNLFKFKNGMEKQINWSLYVQLPENYSKILHEDLFSKHLGKQQAKFLSQKLKCADFLQSKTNLTFLVLNTSFTLEIHKEDFTNNVKLKISCEDVGIAHNLRSFFSKSFKECHTVKETDLLLIDSKLYTTTENLQKKLREGISNNTRTESLLPILEDYNKNVICVLQI